MQRNAVEKFLATAMPGDKLFGESVYYYGDKRLHG